MADIDLNQPAVVMVPDLIPGHDVPEPPRDGESLAECLAYVVHYVPREHWDKVRITSGAGAETKSFTGDEIEALAGRVGDEGAPGGMPVHERR